MNNKSNKKNKTKNKGKRYSFNVSANELQILEFFSIQENISLSIRLLAKDFISRYGIVDICSLPLRLEDPSPVISTRVDYDSKQPTTATNKVSVNDNDSGTSTTTTHTESVDGGDSGTSTTTTNIESVDDSDSSTSTTTTNTDSVDDGDSGTSTISTSIVDEKMVKENSLSAKIEELEAMITSLKREK